MANMASCSRMIVVEAINRWNCTLGLGNYVSDVPRTSPTQAEAAILNDLSRAGKRLMGFCRTNLFKRLESSGHAFLLSVERHILRNFIFLHALENDLSLPIGTTDAGLLDPQSFDEDAEQAVGDIFDTEDDEDNGESGGTTPLRTEEDFRNRADEIYTLFTARYRSRFRWLASHHFKVDLGKALRADAEILRNLLVTFGEWRARDDTKLDALQEVLVNRHQEHKVLVFTQFADTVRYLENELKARGVSSMAAVTGDTPNLTELVRRFSPRSNEKDIPAEEELRVLIATEWSEAEFTKTVRRGNSCRGPLSPEATAPGCGPHRPAADAIWYSVSGHGEGIERLIRLPPVRNAGERTPRWWNGEACSRTRTNRSLDLV